MSPTELHDLTDDAVERALRADAEQWQASHPAPSLDDAVRRLVAEHGAPTRHRSGWWRPVAVAAAVLLIIGGAVTVVSLRRPSPPPPAATSTAEPAPFTVGTLSVPGGFVEASGHVNSPADGFIGRGHYGAQPQQAVRSWASDREIGTAGDLMPESLVLTVTQLDKKRTTPVLPISFWEVQGHYAWVSTEQARVGPSQVATVVTVQWTEGDTGHVLVYSGPAAGSASGRPLTEAEVVAIAQTYQSGPTSTTFTRVQAVVPVTVSNGATPLVLSETRSLSARRGADGQLLVSLRGGPSAVPQMATHCNPYEEAVLTGATPTSVTLTVAVYTPTSGRERPCTLQSYANRWVPVTLDGPLGSRTVIDGSTGKPVTLSGS